MLKNKKQRAFSLIARTSYLLLLSGLMAAITTLPTLAVTQTIPGTNIRQCNPRKAGKYRTFLYYCSQPGDYIGAGQERIFTPVDGDFIVSGKSTGGLLRVYFNGGLDYWDIDFYAPRGAALQKGVYKGAQRYPFQSPTKPGFDFGGSGRGCNTLAAQFTVRQLEYSADGEIELFDATFTQRCEETMPPLFGRIRYNRADAPPK